MSGKLIERLIDLKLPISHAAQAVLMALARHANDDGTSCFPSMDTIQEFARASRGTVVRCIEQLCSLGVVVPERGVGRRRNHYTINATGQPVGVPPQHYNGSGSGLAIEPQAAAQPVDKSPPRPRRSLMVDRRSPTTGLDSIKTLRKERSEEQTSRRKEGKQASQPAPAPLPEPLADQANVLTVVGTYLGNMRASIAGPPGRWPQRTQAQQIEELTAPPKFVRPQPVEPVRSVEEQLAILLGTSPNEPFGPSHAPAMEAVV